jgi:hypothetical protein
LRLLYTFDDDSGSTISDKSGLANSGKLNGTLVAGVSGLGVRAGDGYTGAVTVPNSPSLSLAKTTYSLEAWIKPRAVPSGGYADLRFIICKAAYGGTWEYILYVSGSPASSLCFTTAFYGDFCEDHSFKDDTWAHVAMTCDESGVWRLYVNGVLLSSQTGHSASLNSGSADLLLGTSSYADLDNVQIWGRVRTPAEICADANKSWSGFSCH